jgi:hypothetical protein
LGILLENKVPPNLKFHENVNGSPQAVDLCQISEINPDAEY